MRDIRDMETEAARYAALTPKARAAEDAALAAHKAGIGLSDSDPHQALLDAAAAIMASAQAGENIVPPDRLAAGEAIEAAHGQVLRGARALMMVEAMDAVVSMTDAGVGRAEAIRATSVEAFYAACFLTLSFKRLVPEAFSPARIALFVYELAAGMASQTGFADLMVEVGEGAAIGRAARAGVNLQAEAAEYRATAAVTVAIEAERSRQRGEEGWTPEHDDKHSNGGLALAGACYAISSVLGARGEASSERLWQLLQRLWPWAFKWWKPKDARRDLVRAGALIVAEIERLDRKAAAELEDVSGRLA